MGLVEVGEVRVWVFMYLAITVRSCSLCANGNVDNILSNVSKSSWCLSLELELVQVASQARVELAAYGFDYDF